jgi:glycosyltransferase involved in cell wall biosynthesis
MKLGAPGAQRRPTMRPPVLHVAPFLWSGAGGVITRLCEEQRTEGPVTLVTTGRRDGLEDWPAYRRRLRRAGVVHHAIDFFGRQEAGFWASAARLAELVRDIKPGVIHAHAGVPSCGAVIARTMSGHRARIIGQMYSWGPDRPEWMNVQDTWGLGRTDRVVCSARAYWDLLEGYGVPTRKMTYLPWGLPLDELPWRGDHGRQSNGLERGDRKGRGDSGASPLLGFVGRIEPRKNQLALVEALAVVRRTHPRARVELIGPIADESYADLIRSAIDRHRLQNAIALPGKVRDVKRYVRRWDLFVSLSSDEGQGLAVQEAMALGVPVASRAVAGISDFLTNGRTGLTLEVPGNGRPSKAAAAALASQLVDALGRPAELAVIARRARRMIEARYSWDHTVRAFERLYWS